MSNIYERCSKKEWKGCLSKVKHPTEKQAKQSSKKRDTNYYKCEYCTGWHLTRLKKYYL